MNASRVSSAAAAASGVTAAAYIPIQLELVQQMAEARQFRDATLLMTDFMSRPGISAGEQQELYQIYSYFAGRVEEFLEESDVATALKFAKVITHASSVASTKTGRAIDFRSPKFYTESFFTPFMSFDIDLASVEDELRAFGDWQERNDDFDHPPIPSWMQIPALFSGEEEPVQALPLAAQPGPAPWAPAAPTRSVAVSAAIPGRSVSHAGSPASQAAAPSAHMPPSLESLNIEFHDLIARFTFDLSQPMGVTQTSAILFRDILAGEVSHLFERNPNLLLDGANPVISLRSAIYAGRVFALLPPDKSSALSNFINSVFDEANQAPVPAPPQAALPSPPPRASAAPARSAGVSAAAFDPAAPVGLPLDTAALEHLNMFQFRDMICKFSFSLDLPMGVTQESAELVLDLLIEQFVLSRQGNQRSFTLPEVTNWVFGNDYIKTVVQLLPREKYLALHRFIGQHIMARFRPAGARRADDDEKDNGPHAPYRKLIRACEDLIKQNQLRDANKILLLLKSSHPAELEQAVLNLESTYKSAVQAEQSNLGHWTN